MNYLNFSYKNTLDEVLSNDSKQLNLFVNNKHVEQLDDLFLFDNNYELTLLPFTINILFGIAFLQSFLFTLISFLNHYHYFYFANQSII